MCSFPWVHLCGIKMETTALYSLVVVVLLMDSSLLKHRKTVLYFFPTCTPMSSLLFSSNSQLLNSGDLKGQTCDTNVRPKGTVGAGCLHWHYLPKALQMTGGGMGRETVREIGRGDTKYNTYAIITCSP